MQIKKDKSCLKYMPLKMSANRNNIPRKKIENGM